MIIPWRLIKYMHRGGKVAMTLALRPDLPSDLLSRLIVGDISPVKGNISSEFQKYIEGMRSVEKDGAMTRKEANEILTRFEKVRSCQIRPLLDN